MQKIFEIKGLDWMKGLSVQTGMALGGLFQALSGFDPFDKIGFLQPALLPTELTAPSTNPVKIITSWTDGTTQYIYAHSESKLYQYLRNSPYTQTDVTAQIDITDPTGTYNVAGAIVWKSKYIYAQATDLRSNSLPVAGGSDVQILNGSGSQNLNVRKLCIGADQNLYVGDFARVNQCTSATGTGGNTAAAFAIDNGHTVRDLVNDGRFLVICADNNTIATTSRLVGNYSCRAYFWDMNKTTADVIWDFPGESYLIGCAVLGNTIIVFGYNGIYVCNAVTPPKMILSFLNNSTVSKRPSTPYQITSSPTSVYWGDGSANGQGIYAYGHLPGSNLNIFYSPYTTHSSTYAHTALAYSAGLLFAAVDSPKFYVHNIGSTRGNATAQIAPIQLPQPFKFGYAKVVLRDKLSFGQAVAFSAATAGGIIISDTTTKSYGATNPRKSLKFDITPGTSSTPVFEDLSFTINPQAGATVEKVTIYGTPQDDANANL